MKFKVWSSEENKFISNPEKNFWINPEGKLFHGFRPKLVVNNRYIPVYFTGQIDKNNAEFYEGWISRDKHGNIHLVKKHNGRYETEISGKEPEIIIGAFDSHHQNFEIIGNKYENPELWIANN